METPETLRHGLVDDLCAQGSIRSASVEAAMRAVPRHLFVPGVPVDKAYADDVVQIKQDDAGVPISAASQPTIVALMLEDLDVRPGQRVLEIGAGTGYNAALLAHLVGPAGRVTTVDLDEDIVEGARRGLAAANADAAAVEHDGAEGYAAAAPYDRLIATVGTGRVPQPWLDQLAPGGRLVVPLRLRGSVARSIAFERDGDGSWSSRASRGCAFMPLRGIADDAGRLVPLTPDGKVTVEVHSGQEVGELVGILDGPAVERRTGVRFRPRSSFEWIWLWLACRLDNALSRLNAPADRDLRTMVAVDGPDLAYLALRAGEVDVTARGPGAAGLANRIASEVIAWDRAYRSRDVSFRLAAQGIGAQGQFTFDDVSITWT